MDGFLLSPQQKRLWQAQAANGYDGTVTGRVDISGPLDVPRLRRALDAVVAAHEIARTAFRRPPGLLLPLQVIEEEGTIRWAHHDLSGRGEADQAAESAELLASQWEAADHSQGNNWQATLVTMAPDAHHLFLHLTALTADRYSLAFLVEQIAAAYAGDPLDPYDVLQYADYAEWQTELLEEEAAVQAWRDRAEQAPVLATLPYADSPGNTFTPQRWTETLPAGLTTQLHTLAAAHDAPLENVLLTAWAILLRRLTGQDAMVLGVTNAGRTYEELAGAVGPYEKRLPLPVAIDLDAPFTTALAKMSTLLEPAADTQEYFPDDGTPLPVAWAAVRFPAPFTAGEVTFALAEQRALIDPFQVQLVLHQTAEAITLHFEYDAASYSEEAIKRLAGQYRTLLSSVVGAEDDAPAGTLNLLPAAEAATIATFATTPPPATERKPHPLHETIARHAATDPDHPAVTTPAGTLTYAQLNAQADHLAATLQQCGVGPGVPVALFADPAPETVVGLLAVLKAGGAYVPIDPQYPTERIRFVLEDSRAPVILTQSHLQATIPAGAAQVILLDGPHPTADGHVTGTATLDDPAYVIYTSGSTGRPKGVVVTHRNLWHSTMARLDIYPEPVGRYLLLSSFAFDSSVAGIFWTLATGGTLVLSAPDVVRDPAPLAAFIADQAVTHTLSLPSLYQLVLDAGSADQLASLRTVIVAGEACPPSLVSQHQATLSDTRLTNEYGPTEATVWASVFACREPFTGAVPIGRPVPGVQIRVLNDYGQPVPVGVAGELVIGGPTVAQGYLHRPGLTEDRFVTLKLNGKSTRTYRTGDLARWRSDGNLDFLGRADFQVKIRGYRIELGEIEAHLDGHPAVSEAVAVAPATANVAEQRLVAYLTTHTDLNVTDLRTYLLDRLPAFMVPDTFVFLDHLPRTPNGKIDRTALPDPARTRAQLGSEYVAPRDPLEEILVEIWSDVLDYDQVGIHDNFFDLGGHSILVTQMVGRVRDLLPLECSLRAVFDNPTVSQLADHLRAENGRETADKSAELLLQVVAA